jgi:hypothetical protein
VRGPGVRTECLGVVSHDVLKSAHFIQLGGNTLLVLNPAAGPEVLLNRMGEGDYSPCTSTAPAASVVPPEPPVQIQPAPGPSWRIAAADGCDLGSIHDPVEILSSRLVAQLPDGSEFVAARRNRLFVYQLAGLGDLRTIASGEYVVGVPARGR